MLGFFKKKNRKNKKNSIKAKFKKQKQNKENSKISDSDTNFKKHVAKDEQKLKQRAKDLNNKEHQPQSSPSIDLYARPKVYHHFRNASKQLDEMISLQGVKQQVNHYINNAIYIKRARKLGRKENHGSLNIIFEGSPGTGKTEVARLVGKILYDKGICQNSTFHEYTVGDFESESWVGSEFTHVRNAVKSCIGGVMFIDEAYELIPDGSGNGSATKRNIVSELIKQIEDHRDELVVILAGYTDLMEEMLNTANPGLQSRFNYKIYFPNYNLNEMFQILKLHADLSHCLIKTSDYPLLYAELKHFIPFAKKNDDYGNGRTARNIIEKIKDCRNNRKGKDMKKMSLKELDTVNAQDIERGFDLMYQNDTVQKSELKKSHQSSYYIHMILATNKHTDMNGNSYAYDKIVPVDNVMNVLDASNKLLYKNKNFIANCNYYTIKSKLKSFTGIQHNHPKMAHWHLIKSLNEFINLFNHNSGFQISKDESKKNVENKESQK